MNTGSGSVRRFLLPLAVMGGLILLFFNRMALSNLVLARGDVFLYFYPYWHVAAEALRELQVPLWNPAIFMGAPLLANSQMGFFYPLNWPIWLLFDTPYAASASILLHLVIAAGGAYLLSRRVFDLPPGAALVAAASFALGGYLTAQVEHINQLQGLAWLPWFLVAVDIATGSTRRARLRGMILLSVLFCLQLLAGHTQTTFITAVALTIWITFKWLAGRYLVPAAGAPSQSFRRLVSSLAVVAAGGLLALALSAVQLVPTLELIRYSSRQGGLPVNEVLSFSLPPHLLTPALLPTYGQSIFTEYVAMLPLTILFLAVLGAWEWRKRPAVCAALALAGWGVFLALGAYNPLYWLLARVPGFNLFRAPARWLSLYALGAALLAGVGWHFLWGWAGWEERRRKEAWRGRVLPALLLFVLLAAALVVWAYASGALVGLYAVGPEAAYEAPSTLTLLLWLVEVLLIAGFLLAAALVGQNGRRRISLALMLVAALALGFLATRSLPYNQLTTPEAYFDLRPATTRLQAAGGMPPGRLLSLSDTFFDPGDQGEIDSIYQDQLSALARYDYTVAIKQKEINAPNLPMIYDLASVDGFDGGILPLRSYSDLMRLLLPDGQATTDGRLREHLGTVPDSRWLDLFNARYLITDKTGDVWIDGVYFDRQHSQTFASGEAVRPGYLPDFEATELRLLTSDMALQLSAVTTAGDEWYLPFETVESGYQKATFPRAAVLAELAVSGCANPDPCVVEGLTLFDERDAAFQSLVPGAYRLIHSGDVKIYENLDVLPRAYMTTAWQWAGSSQEVLSIVGDSGFDFRRSVVLLDEEGNSNLEGGTSAVTDPDSAQIVEYGTERIVVRTDSTSAAALVLSDAYYPGWQASVDNEPAEIYRANGLFRAVLLPGGAHEVQFNYEPAVLKQGLLATLAALVLLLALLLFALLDGGLQK